MYIKKVLNILRKSLTYIKEVFLSVLARHSSFCFPCRENICVSVQVYLMETWKIELIV